MCQTGSRMKKNIVYLADRLESVISKACLSMSTQHLACISASYVALPARNMPVKAITSIDKVSLISLAGTSFMGTHGVAERFMEALATVGVNVILTSQGSSEHSISVAVADTDGQRALEAVEVRDLRPSNR